MLKIRGSSKELQEVSLVALINDPYLLSKCLSEIKDEFFDNLSFRLIYKCIKNYYTKYMVLPNREELKSIVAENYTPDYGNDVDNIIPEIDRLFDQRPSSEDFSYEKTVEFIRRNKIENSLNKVVKFMQQDGDIDLDSVATELRDSIYLNFTRAPVFNLADISSVKEVKEEALGPGTPIIVKFFIDDLNKAMQYKGMIPGTLNMITSPPGRGKTTMLINQGVCTAKQGYKILHIFLGDMSKYDGLLRYLSCLTGVPTARIVDLSDDDLIKFIQKYNMSGFLSNIDIASYAAGQLNTSQLIEEITTIQKDKRVHYDVIIVDYDENIADDEDNMYKSGGNVYNKLALFAVVNKSVIFIASQPKTGFWDKDIITLEAASESSKKQKIIDMMITLGKTSKTSSVGTMYLAKNRRGEDSKVYRIKIDGATAVMTHISELEYNRIKQQERSSESS